MRNSPRIKTRSASIFCAAVFLLVPSVRTQAQDLLPELVRRIKPSAVAIETFAALSAPRVHDGTIAARASDPV